MLSLHLQHSMYHIRGYWYYCHSAPVQHLCLFLNWMKVVCFEIEWKLQERSANQLHVKFWHAPMGLSSTIPQMLWRTIENTKILNIIQLYINICTNEHVINLFKNIPHICHFFHTDMWINVKIYFTTVKKYFHNRTNKLVGDPSTASNCRSILVQIHNCYK